VGGENGRAQPRRVHLIPPCDSWLCVARRAGHFARAGPRALVMNKRSKLYCRKEKSMEIIAENLRTVI
jgi:hypothetical protein